MKRILILIGILIFGCRSSPEASFENLNTALINWYLNIILLNRPDMTQEIIMRNLGQIANQGEMNIMQIYHGF